MKANELRIGNYVTDGYYDTFKTIIKVESINEQGINLSIEDDGKWAEISDRWIEPEYRFNLLFGIPLTEEWLLRFNYELKGGCYYQSIFSDVEFFLSDGKLFCELFGNSLSNIEYVHDLQNLHFAIYKEELKIK